MIEPTAAPGALVDIETLPSTPGAIIGYTSRGPVYLIAGGSGDGEGSDDEPTADAAGDDSNDDQDDEQAAEGDDGQDDDGRTYDAAYVKRLRREAAARRNAEKAAREQLAEQQAALKKALGVLGIGGGDETPTPEQLAEQLEQAQAQVWTTAVEHTVERAARSLGVDAEALLDSRRFIDSLDEFVDDDPRDPTFRQKLTEHIKQYAQEHKGFAAQAATKSGGDFSGGPGSTPDPSKMTMADYVKWRAKRRE
jgi:hypothetical protein